MSSNSDKVVYDESVEEQDNVNLFESKKYTYITDSSSSNGAFSGQIQFDLNTLSSQNQWTDLSQAVITFPVKLSITNGADLAPGACTINSATIKSGFHNFIDSAQIVIGSTTVQSSQIFTNIDVNYKILTEWSADTLAKYGSTLGVSLDDLDVSYDTDIGVSESTDNQLLSTTVRGFDIWDQRNNKGPEERCRMFNNNVSTSALGRSILGTNQVTLGKGNVQTNAALATTGSDTFVLYALGTIRLKDISPAVSALPVMKSLKGFVYLNYNASTHALTNANGSANLTAVNSQSIFGRCAPAILNYGTSGWSPNATTGSIVTFRADINATTSNLSTAKYIQTNAVLYAPYYVATPEVDRNLTMKKTVRYNERFVTQFNLTENGNFSGTLSPGISNPKRVILYPYLTGAGTSGNSGFITNPLLSPFDGTPFTSSPFAAIKDWQLYVGNVPMFQQPVTQDFQTFLNEVSQNGEDGGLVDTRSSGLLNQRLWNTLYRYYTCDIGRRMNSEDGASKSIQISCTNATNCPMTVIAIIHYEREIVVETASGQIMQTM
jgi:hypothetical protein